MNKLLAFILLCIPVFCYCQINDSCYFIQKSVSIKKDSLQLYGTLTIPKNTTKYVAFIIPGSGATNRDGNNLAAGLNCDAYKQLAKELALKNIASLRIDKRGVGESVGEKKGIAAKVFEIEVEDAKDWVKYLKSTLQFSEITIIGHSQGALTALLASGSTNKFISINGIGLRASETIKAQLAQQPPVVLEKAIPILDSLDKGLFVKNIPAFLAPLFKPEMQPYLISWFRFDPATELSKLTIPVLVIQGDNDIQIKVEDAKRFISKSPKAQLLIVKDMNHVFKIVPNNRTENLKGYTDPKLPISESLSNGIVDFILKD